ncbi:heavy metal translocating P-type ATPase [Pedobacter sp. MC2016-05]|uniref:heavy metal translocating P-type ATPase n=1 Tax=Pedobacter sp. MC2016-05 TaxID=2994474 RepID=UPI0022451A81|nr:heavy metal translocating P-type ATPase [Pedobacter sp. MC2016-05]MCX2473680.1 heavy metal translocating P-type ATPase [Pedobacter sp. MC2016-05]
MSHPHDKEDNCCSSKPHQDQHQHKHAEGDEHDHDHGGDPSSFKAYLPATVTLIMLLIGIVFDNFLKIDAFKIIRPFWYIVAYLPVGIPVLKEVWETFKAKDFFTEFSLMSIATIGAFAIGEYPEGVTVMLFYTIGELFQMAAVNRAKRNISALLDVRADVASVLRNGKYETVNPETVAIGEIIQVKVGEKIPLDGDMLSEKSSFNAAALTGESKPKTINKGEKVLAGMLNLDRVIEIKVAKAFADSALSRILEMVQNATTRKAKTELFIRKFAKIYTPIVFFLALALVTVPILFLGRDYHFQTWLYRSLVFLVISCPCALVISIPLGYFGGIGAASAHGILFKGSNFLDLMAKLNTIVMDKTGTLTRGVFNVQQVESLIDEDEFITLLAAVEGKSTHPIAKAIVEYAAEKDIHTAENIEEIAGMGLKGVVNGKEVLAGNVKLLEKFKIDFDTKIKDIEESIVVVAVDGKYTGYVLIADEIKEDAVLAIKQLHENGVKQVVMLSGDKTSIVKKVAGVLGIDSYFGDLLPEDKVAKLEEIKKDRTKVVAFVGDGINDTPVLAISDIGMAMGAMGSDAAIETADVVIQTDQPSKIATAIKIGKATKKVVIQNIVLAFAVKALVLILGAGGLATMWEAVFADVGVALLAILNAVRIQKMRF